jgi:dethiobiotin synthetase
VKKFVVTGTDTGVGKTIFSAALTGALQGVYWKPVQAGLEDETDSEVVARLSGRPALPEAYRLKLAASPHRAAAAENIVIDPVALALPQTEVPLVVEGAGGLMVPLTEKILLLDVFTAWNAPLILCARTSLGTINHTLLSLGAIRARAIPLLGVAFMGEANEDSETIICKISGARKLGRMAPVTPTKDTIARAFAEGFNLADFA